MKSYYICSILIFCGLGQNCKSETYEECINSTVYLFSSYYKVDVLREFHGFFPDKVYINNNTIRYSVKSEVYQLSNKRDLHTNETIEPYNNVVHDKDNEIYIKNGNLFLKKGNLSVLIYENKDLKVEDVTIDTKTRVLYVKTNTNKVLAIKLQNLFKHKNQCMARTIPNLGSEITAIYTDNLTGNILLGAKNKETKNGRLMIVKKIGSDPCLGLMSNKALLKDFKTMLDKVQKYIVDKMNNQNTPQIKHQNHKPPNPTFLVQFQFNQIMETFKNILSTINVTNSAELDEKIDEQKQELERNNNNRLMLGKQIFTIKSEFDTIPTNITTLFKSKVRYDLVPFAEIASYQCALSSEFTENESQIRIYNNINSQISENMNALLNEALNEDEINALYNQQLEEELRNVR